MTNKEDLSFYPVIHAGLLKSRERAWCTLQAHQLMFEHLRQTLERDPEDVKIRQHYEGLAKVIDDLTLQLRVTESALGLGKLKPELQ
jgi:hypothetical protein